MMLAEPKIQKFHAGNSGMMRSHFRRNIGEAMAELRQTGPAWLEVVFGAVTVAAGAWSFFYPYVSRWLEAAPLGCCSIFLVVGINQVASFFSRSVRLRLWAANSEACLWMIVSVVLLSDRVPGWMTPVAPLILVSQIVVHCKLIERAARQVTGNGL